MARKTCILCERELLPFGKCVIDLHGTKQTLCGECKRAYEKSALEEKFVLWEKMLRSSALEDYETVRAGIARARENWEKKQGKERSEQELVEKKRAYMESMACCCDTTMTYLGSRLLLLGRNTLLTGGLDALTQGIMSVDVFRCERCGQLKFFQMPDFLPQEEETSHREV